MIFRILVFCLVTSMASAQVNDQLYKSAKEYAAANEDGNWKKVVSLTHPKLISFIGGEQKMLADASKGEAQMERNGLELVAFEISKPLEENRTENGIIFCAIPARVTIKDGKTKLYSEAPILAISEDGGNSWTFISVAQIDRLDLIELFPDLPKRLDLSYQKVYSRD